MSYHLVERDPDGHPVGLIPIPDTNVDPHPDGYHIVGDGEVMRFDVTLSDHDHLKAGRTEPHRMRVAVVADTYWDGQLAAAQFAATLHALRGLPAMPTGAYPVI